MVELIQADLKEMYGGRVHVSGGGSDPQVGRGLPQNRPSGGDVEGDDGDSQSLLRHLHCLTPHPPWFLGGLRHRYQLPQGQTFPAVNGHEVGSLI